MTMLLRTPSRRIDSRALWRDVVCDHFVPLEVDTDSAGTFTNSVAADTIGCLPVTELITSAQSVRRTRLLANRSESSGYKATVQLSGRSEITQDKRTAVLSPGDWGLYDTTRPYAVCVEQDAHFLVLQIQPEQMPAWESYLSQSVARCFDSRHGSARIAMNTLQLGLAESANLSDAAARDVSTSVLRMLGLNLSEQTGAALISGLDEVRQAQLRQIQHYVVENIHDPELSATRLAAHFRMSRRYLYKLFSGQDLAPADYILHVRLERCKQRLTDATCTRQIGELAYQYGFSDATAFSHAFRRRYGMSPTEWRRQHLS